MSTKITGEQVKAAVLNAGITYIPHHDCGLCGEKVAYQVFDGNLFFCPGCGCSYSPPEPRTWESAAEFINMQNEKGRIELMAKFGFVQNGENDATPI